MLYLSSEGQQMQTAFTCWIYTELATISYKCACVRMMATCGRYLIPTNRFCCFNVAACNYAILYKENTLVD